MVLCHSADVVYGMHVNPLADNVAFAFFNTIGRIGVPIFLMLTGALVLPKRFEEEVDFQRFWVHNLLPLVVTIEVWVVIYNIYLWAEGATFQKGAFIRELLLIQNVPLDHWWYLPMIVRLYMILPCISVVLRHGRLRWYRPAVLVLFIYVDLFGTYEFMRSGLALPTSASVPVSDSYSVLACMCYAIVGYLIDSRKALRRVSRHLLSLMVLFGLFLTWIINMAVGDVWYSNPGLLIAGAGIFEITLRRASLESVRRSRLVTSMAKMSFGVYFVHMPVLRTLRGALTFGSMPYEAVTLLLWALTLVLSFLVVLLLWRPHKLRLLLFDAK